MTCFSLDLTIDAALTDPMIAAAMRADRVDPSAFEHLLRSTARTLDDERRAGATLFATLVSQARVAMTGCVA